MIVTVGVGPFGVTRFEDLEVPPSPLAFLATTVNTYDVPLVNPPTTHDRWVVAHDLLPGCDVTTNRSPVQSKSGRVHETTAE